MSSFDNSVVKGRIIVLMLTKKLLLDKLKNGRSIASVARIYDMNQSSVVKERYVVVLLKVLQPL